MLFFFPSSRCQHICQYFFCSELAMMRKPCSLAHYKDAN